MTEKCQDGWFKGTSLRTAASGVFPGNYVTPVSRSVGCSQGVEGVLSLSVNDPVAIPVSGCDEASSELCSCAFTQRQRKPT